MSSYKKKFFTLFATIAIMIVSVITITESHSSPNAFNGLCASMGAGMEKRDNASLDLLMSPDPDSKNRKWTVEELFKNSINYTSYYGEGQKEFFWQGKVDRGLKRGWVTEEIWNDPVVQDNVNGARSYGCVVARGNGIPQVIMRFASGMTSLSNSITSIVIGEDFMAEGIMNVIGGKTESDDGIIGALYNNIYTPLVVIAVLIMAVSIIYKGLIKMQYREALTALLWSVGAFLVGIILMTNPRGMVELPQKATSTITSCVMGAMSGQNCMTGEVSAPELTTGTECRSAVGGGSSDQAGLIMNGMNCTIWKSFILEKWADEQFGVPYNQLYTMNPPPGGKIWDALPKGEGARYCVNLESSKSASDLAGKQIVVDGASGNTVCNVALYQLYLQTNMQDETNHSGDGYKDNLIEVKKNGKDYDARWFDIIVPMAKDSSNWEMWTGAGRFVGRTGSSAMSIFTVFMASIVLISLGVFAAVYKITGIITMAFAPIFFLFAIEPTRGKRIFLGWLETLVSSILKYFAVTMLLVVSVTLYAGVLNNTTGFASLVAIIVLTVTMMSYRKEVVDLIGATNMGGQKLSNKVDDVFQGTKKQAKDKGGAYVAGRVGGRIGASQARNNEIEARESTIGNLQAQLATATSDGERELIERNINSQEESLREIGHGKIRAGEDATEEEKEEIKKLNKDIKKNKKDTLSAGSKEAGAESLGRAMRRGTSFTANTFRQQQRVNTSLSKDLASTLADEEKFSGEERVEFDRREKERLEDEREIEEKAKVVNTQRKPANKLREEFKGVLSDKEVRALHQFSNEISNDTEDSSLVNRDANETDKNKKLLIANEINARVKGNAIKGNSSPELASSNLVDQDILSNPDLEIRSKVKFNEYLETGNKESLKEYSKTYNKLKDRDEELVKNLVTPEFVSNNKPTDFVKLEIDKNEAKLENKDIPDKILKERESLIDKGVIKNVGTVSKANDKGNDNANNEGPKDNNNNSNNRKGPKDNNSDSSDRKGPKDNNSDSNNRKGPKDIDSDSNNKKGPKDNDSDSNDRKGPKDNDSDSNDRKGPSNKKYVSDRDKKHSSNNAEDKSSKTPFRFTDERINKKSDNVDTEMLNYLDGMNLEDNTSDGADMYTTEGIDFNSISPNINNDDFFESFISEMEEDIDKDD